MADIFLSYRRQDSQSATGRLADALEVRFGPARVFRDHESIVAGEDFAAAIHRAIDASTVVLVVIGPHWVTAVDADGRRRLDDPGDFVRLEIEAALAAGVPILPVLVEGAVMPSAQAVPTSLGAFTRCQAMDLSDTRWRYDAQRLAEALQARFAIEALPGDTALPGTVPGGWMRSLAPLAIDMLDLATHPTRLILRRQTGQAIDHVRAFLFLLGSLAGGNVMLLLGFSVAPSEPRTAMGELLHFASLTAYGVLIGVFTVTLLLIVLAIAWRLAGTRIEYRQLSLVMAYVVSGLWLGTCLGVFCYGLGLQFSDESAFSHAVETLWPSRGVLPTGTAWAERIAIVDAQLRNMLRSGPVVVGLLLATGVWIATGCWLLVAWQAFSMSFGVSRWRAALATLIWLALLGGAGRLISDLVST